MHLPLLLFALASAMNPPAPASTYRLRLDDPKAIYLEGAKGDGVADDTSAIQRAIDKVQEAHGQGILFVPSGRYRLTRTLVVWGGIRVIGWGETRPTFFLGPRTPGFQSDERQMVFFAGNRPESGKADLEHATVEGLDRYYPEDANPGTFYSAMSNIDIEIAEGNPAAVGIRGRYAQHCYLSHMDFRLRDAFAGIHDTGNIAEDLRFFGGRHGLVTRTPSPGWQFTLMDSSFEGQTEASIRTYETGLTLIRPSFRNTPTAVAVEPGHTEQLWMSDARMESLTGPALEISRESSVRTQITLENIACRNVPTFAHFRESGKVVSGKGQVYRVREFIHGLSFDDVGGDGEVRTESQIDSLANMPAPAPSDVRTLPAQETWANLAALGAKGDGKTDDTVAIEAAIDRYKAIYLPTGTYRVTRPIRLKPDTVLIGLHPYTTRLAIEDGTPAFMGVPEPAPKGNNPWRPPSILFPGNATPLLEAPQGGANIVTGIGLDTGGNNPGATACLWKAGADSMLDDVKFLGGHGSVEWSKIYNANHTADPDPKRKWDAQYPSLWVTDGGGGTFKNLWTASTFAGSGMLVSNTSTPGRVYEVSSEHHVRNEVQIRNASNWALYALQTEEERGEGPFCLPLEIDASSNILVANLNMYRVISMFQPYPYGVKVSASKNVRFRNIHCGSNSKVSFDSLLFDSDRGIELRQREFARLDVGSGGRKTEPSWPSLVDRNASLVKLAGGFFNISGGAVDSKGNFWFVDAHWHRIYCWNVQTNALSLVQDAPLYPVNLFIDDANNVNVVSYAGKGIVYSFKPGQDRIEVLKARPSADRPDVTYALAVTDWAIDGDLRKGKTIRKAFSVASPDGRTLLPVDQSFLDGDTSWGVKDQDVLRSFGLAKAKPGDTVYMMGEADCQTFAATLGADGSLKNGHLFAEQGGEALAVDPAGNVFMGAGQIYIYDSAGQKLGSIHTPERPIQLMFGGPDGRTLFIAARTSLYSLRIR